LSKTHLKDPLMAGLLNVFLDFNLMKLDKVE